jgi:hypothetical protein
VSTPDTSVSQQSAVSMATHNTTEAVETWPSLGDVSLLSLPEIMIFRVMPLARR